MTFSKKVPLSKLLEIELFQKVCAYRCMDFLQFLIICLRTQDILNQSQSIHIFGKTDIYLQ